MTEFGGLSVSPYIYPWIATGLSAPRNDEESLNTSDMTSRLIKKPSYFSRHREARAQASAAAIQKKEAALPPFRMDCRGAFSPSQ